MFFFSILTHLCQSEKIKSHNILLKFNSNLYIIICPFIDLFVK